MTPKGHGMDAVNKKYGRIAFDLIKVQKIMIRIIKFASAIILGIISSTASSDAIKCRTEAGKYKYRHYQCKPEEIEMYAETIGLNGRPKPTKEQQKKIDANHYRHDGRQDTGVRFSGGPVQINEPSVNDGRE